MTAPDDPSDDEKHNTQHNSTRIVRIFVVAMPAQDDLLAPLAAVLGQIQARLSAIEGKVGIDGPPPASASGAAAPVAGAFYVGLGWLVL